MGCPDIGFGTPEIRIRGQKPPEKSLIESTHQGRKETERRRRSPPRTRGIETHARSPRGSQPQIDLRKVGVPPTSLGEKTQNLQVGDNRRAAARQGMRGTMPNPRETMEKSSTGKDMERISEVTPKTGRKVIKRAETPVEIQTGGAWSQGPVHKTQREEENRRSPEYEEPDRPDESDPDYVGMDGGKNGGYRGSPPLITQELVTNSLHEQGGMSSTGLGDEGEFYAPPPPMRRNAGIPVTHESSRYRRDSPEIEILAMLTPENHAQEQQTRGEAGALPAGGPMQTPQAYATLLQEGLHKTAEHVKVLMKGLEYVERYCLATPTVRRDVVSAIQTMVDRVVQLDIIARGNISTYNRDVDRFVKRRKVLHQAVQMPSPGGSINGGQGETSGRGGMGKQQLQDMEVEQIPLPKRKMAAYPEQQEERKRKRTARATGPSTARTEEMTEAEMSATSAVNATSGERRRKEPEVKRVTVAPIRGQGSRQRPSRPGAEYSDTEWITAGRRGKHGQQRPNRQAVAGNTRRPGQSRHERKLQNNKRGPNRGNAPARLEDPKRRRLLSKPRQVSPTLT